MNNLQSLKHIKLLSYLLLGLSYNLTGCATTPVIEPFDISDLLVDSAFVEPQDIPRTNQIFELSEAQINRLDQRINPSLTKSTTKQLIKKVLSRDYAEFDYDNSYTRTATETFELKQGNCLSMVIMTAAMAKHLGIDFRVQELQSAPVWSRDGGLYLLNGHINIKLNTNGASSEATMIFGTQQYITLDFIPSRVTRVFSTKKIDQKRLSAMYFVNLAADAMVNQQWHRGYYLLKSAIIADATYSAGWNNLGVLYRHNNLLVESEAVYRHAMALAPDDINVITNFSLLLAGQGRLAEHSELQQKYNQALKKNPFHYYDLAQLSFAQQNYLQAIKQYQQAIEYSNSVALFHFGLFKSYYALNKIKKAKSSLLQAQQLSNTQIERLKYNAKLALLADG